MSKKVSSVIMNNKSAFDKNDPDNNNGSDEAYNKNNKSLTKCILNMLILKKKVRMVKLINVNKSRIICSIPTTELEKFKLLINILKPRSHIYHVLLRDF